MTASTNEFQQPIGFPVANWQPRQHPPKVVLDGRTCALEPLDVAKHGRSLYEANRYAPDGRYWTYLSYGPFTSFAAYQRWLEDTCLGDDPQFYAVANKQPLENAPGKALGIASYLRIHPEVGVIEVGHINFAGDGRQKRRLQDFLPGQTGATNY